MITYDDEPKPWLDDGDVKLYHGDALERLREMPSESVQCICTSPPFWGLRDYGTGTWEGGDADCDHVQRTGRNDTTPEALARRAEQHGTGTGAGSQVSVVQFADTCGKCGARRVDQQIGLEETPDEWCARLVAVMREARRVLRNDGVCWLECGDSYTTGTGRNPDRSYMDGGATSIPDSVLAPRFKPVDIGMKPKDLVGAPWRRITETVRGDQEAHARPKHLQSAKSGLSLSGSGSKEWAERGGKRETLGWEPTCDCPRPSWWPLLCRVPCVVLDPFMGSGTTALVARRLNRHAIGIELNAEYLAISARRLQQPTLWSQPQ